MIFLMFVNNLNGKENALHDFQINLLKIVALNSIRNRSECFENCDRKIMNRLDLSSIPANLEVFLSITSWKFTETKLFTLNLFKI